jgi:hypothetical protein
MWLKEAVSYQLIGNLIELRIYSKSKYPSGRRNSPRLVSKQLREELINPEAWFTTR